jgi:hypothetical protein
MHTEDSFKQLIKAIESKGFDRETAGKFAVIIGDTPHVDEAGNTVVIDNEGKELARFKLDFFESESDDQHTTTTN